MLRTELPGKLLEAWVYQKSLVLKRAGLPPNVMQWERAVALWGPTMEKLATLVGPWDVPPGLLMEAVFGASRRKGHSQGPFINALLSDSLLRRSLAEHLDLPLERILQVTRKADIVSAMEANYNKTLASMLEVAMCDEFGMLSATMFPAAYRFYLGLSMGAKFDLRSLAVDAIDEIEHDHRLLLWLESRGVFFDTIAAVANAAVVVTDGRRAVQDVISAALKLVAGDQTACKDKTAGDCLKQAVTLLRKSITMLENESN